MAIYTYYFDAKGRDHQVDLDTAVISAVGEQQLLWVDVSGRDESDLRRVGRLFGVADSLCDKLCQRVASVDPTPTRPRVDLYSQYFYVGMQAVQSRADDPLSFRAVPLHFLVFPNVVVTVHDEPVAFLESFDHSLIDDTHLGGMDGPSLLAALLNGHVIGFHRALEVLEALVDRIDDAALLLRGAEEERDLLDELVRARRRLALVRRTLLPHREVYATLARPQFAPFLTPGATDALRLSYEQLERAVEATDTARELVLSSFDIFTTQTALRTNEVVKALTLVSALLLPIGALAGVALLFLKTPVYDLGVPGFWGVLIAIVLLDVAFLALASKRDLL